MLRASKLESRVEFAGSFRTRLAGGFARGAGAGGRGGGRGATRRAGEMAAPLRGAVAVVGGGIVGAAVAREVGRRLRAAGAGALGAALLEKEAHVAAHQTGRNSGVVHCGVYYKTGSLKARLCVRGSRLAYEYCDARGIPYNRCGKLIVASEASELGRLRALYENGQANGVPGLTYLGSPEEVRAREPHCAGIAAVHCATTGVVDWGRVARSFAGDFERDSGGEVLLQHEVLGAESGEGGVELRVRVGGPGGREERMRFQHAIFCGGLHSDRLAAAAEGGRAPLVIPVRGEYLVLKPEARHLVKGNIYPVPNPIVPFLGVHFTPRMDGSMWLGPNAVYALSREGYSWGDISLRDLWEALRYAGFWKLAATHWAFGLDEVYRSLVTAAQVRRMQAYIPELRVEHVERGPTGVRAIALGEDGKMVDDFVFESGGARGGGPARVLHVLNAPSPAATSSLAIAEVVAKEAFKKFQLGDVGGGDDAEASVG